MTLTKYLLGELITRNNEKNVDLKYGVNEVRGVLNSKGISSTKVDVANRDLSKFLVVRPGGFIFNHRVHDKLGLGYNTTNEVYIFTNDYVAFYVKPDVANSILLPDYLYMWYLRNEFDRYMLFNTYGSATLFFNWDNMCELEIELPSIEIQQKFVDVYKAMVENQKAYENGLTDLKLTCDAYIEDLRKKMSCEKIASYISEVDERNDGNKVKLAQGVDINMQFIDPKRVAEDFEKGRVVRHRQFAYNKVMKANGTKLPIALRDGEDCVISGSYNVFKVNDEDKLIPEYLMMWLSRAETQRYLGFNSWGSTRDVINFADLGATMIPIPDVGIQQAIVDIYKCYQKRKNINERLKALIKDICPILIRGSIDEALKEA